MIASALNMTWKTGDSAVDTSRAYSNRRSGKDKCSYCKPEPMGRDCTKI